MGGGGWGARPPQIKVQCKAPQSQVSVRLHTIMPIPKVNANRHEIGLHNHVQVALWSLHNIGEQGVASLHNHSHASMQVDTYLHIHLYIFNNIAITILFTMVLCKHIDKSIVIRDSYTINTNLKE